MNLLLFFFIIRSIKAGFYEKTSEEYLGEILLRKSAVPSALACTHYCYRTDRDAGIVYDGDICQCVKKELNSLKNQELVSGIFLKPKKLQKMKEIVTEVNVALNKPSSQISTYNNHFASFGNDGNGNTASVTRWEAGDKWWQIDLLKPIQFIRVDILLNSYAFNDKRYENVSLAIRNDDNEPWKICKKFGRPTTLRLILTSCDSATKNTRYFKLIQHRQTAKNYNLYLSEFRVFISKTSFAP